MEVDPSCLWLILNIKLIPSKLLMFVCLFCLAFMDVVILFITIKISLGLPHLKIWLQLNFFLYKFGRKIIIFKFVCFRTGFKPVGKYSNVAESIFVCLIRFHKRLYPHSIITYKLVRFYLWTVRVPHFRVVLDYFKTLLPPIANGKV